MELDENVDEQLNDVPSIDSMTVASVPDNDTTWMDNMQINNDPLNYDFGGEDNNVGDNEDPEMEIPLDDDLCNAQMLARSIVANLQCNEELFSSSCVWNEFKVGMVFESKAKLLQ